MNYDMSMMILGVDTESSFNQVRENFDDQRDRILNDDFSWHQAQTGDSSLATDLLREQMLQELTNAMLTIKAFRAKYGA